MYSEDSLVPEGVFPNSFLPEVPHTVPQRFRILLDDTIKDFFQRLSSLAEFKDTASLTLSQALEAFASVRTAEVLDGNAAIRQLTLIGNEPTLSGWLCKEEYKVRLFSSDISGSFAINIQISPTPGAKTPPLSASLVSSDRELLPPATFNAMGWVEFNIMDINEVGKDLAIIIKNR
jgi:hypothetical protein